MPDGYPDPFSSLRATSDAPAAAEPTTWWGGAMKGIKDYVGDLGQGMFASAAQPRTAGDMLGLMIPGAAGTAMKGMRAAAPAVGETTLANPMLRDAKTMTGAFAGDRTTGHFAEPPGGLRDTAAGKLTRYPMPGKAVAPVAEAPVSSMTAFGEPTSTTVTKSLDPMGKAAEADAQLQRQYAAAKLDPREQGAGTLGDKPIPGKQVENKSPVRMRLDELPPEIRNQAPGTKFTDTETGVVYIRDKTGKLFIDRSKAKGSPSASPPP